MYTRAGLAHGSLTVTTFNVLHTDRDRTGRALTAAAGLNATAPNLVLLQELPFEHGMSSTYLDTLIDATGLSVAYAEPLTAPHRDRAGRSGLGILYGPALSLEDAGTLPPPPGLEGYLPVPQGSWAVFAEASPEAETGGRAIVVVNLHGVWGGSRAWEREQQILHADRYATLLRDRWADRDPLVILGGDLNAVPESSSVRYLTGLQSLDGAGTYWVDAWAHAGNDTAGYTTTADSAWFLDTARAVGITEPEAVPARRIDYLFVRDWVYGRRGQPLRTWVDLTGTVPHGRHASDHFAVTTVLDTGTRLSTDARISTAATSLN